MCEVQAKLVAWLDHELLADEAEVVERHVGGCGECRRRVAAYARVNETFEAYCDAVMAAKTQPRVPRWVPVLVGAAVAAAVLFFSFPRMRVSPPIPAPTITATVAPVPAPPRLAPARNKTPRKLHLVEQPRGQAVRWQPPEAAVQIAIPADAMFPPGTMPAGMNFIAELSIAPDGSVRQVRLRQ